MSKNIVVYFAIVLLQLVLNVFTSSFNIQRRPGTLRYQPSFTNYMTPPLDNDEFLNFFTNFYFAIDNFRLSVIPNN